MEDFTRTRKAEESAWRRYQAAAWLESKVGPLGFSGQPSELELVSRLRNGLILCNAINKVHPGAVPKVVEIHSNLQSINREFQPLPAYQYFENVKNFLVAVAELRLPAFEASDLERDSLEEGSAAKVVDCILALKSYHENKQNTNGNGFYKPARSPGPLTSTGRYNGRPILSESCKHLDMSVATEKDQTLTAETQKLQDLLVKALVDQMDESKENINSDILISSRRNGDGDPMALFSKILFSSLEGKLHSNYPELKSMFKEFMKEKRDSPATSPATPLNRLPDVPDLKNFPCCEKKGNSDRRRLLKFQEKELLDLKTLLVTTKKEFEALQSNLQKDMRQLGIQVQEMSSAAIGYHKVLKENRKLFNTVQDLKGNIRVYCRIRPSFIAGAKNVVDFTGEDGTLVISDPLKSLRDGKKVFQFNRIFDVKATQDDVFMDTQPLIRSVMDGYNVCIFAYGQTGSGKTYTMSGPPGGYGKEMGINYLALNDLFQLSSERKDAITYEIQVQMVEIYNEQVRDLLTEDSTITKLEIRSCAGEDGLSLPDARMHTVKSTSDVLNLMKLGEANRVVSSTAMNNRSSRSHSVLTVHVHGKETAGGTLRSNLHLVDLAGSERVDKSEVTGDRLKEAQYINKSLSCLGDVITSLAQKNSHIPYRNSKLTLLLQDSLGGNAKTLMIAHVSPEGDSYGETISTLKFAQRVSSVELGVARANKESTDVLHLKEQVENLKKALAMKQVETGQFHRTAMTERTPPRLRRLSIENGSNTKYDKSINIDDKKVFKTPNVTARSRRLSLEGPTTIGGKKTVIHQSKEFSSISKPLQFECPTLGGYGQDAEVATTPHEQASNQICTTEMYHSSALRSPTSKYQKRTRQMDSRMKDISSLHLTMTPDPQPNVSKVMPATGNGKGGSQFRKSLRTIGKLINGTDKRVQQNTNESDLPANNRENKNDARSPVTADARASRRQSLTGIPTLSRRAKPIDSDESRRNARTPPPAGYLSSKAMKQWN